ncbi:MAG: lamin tail domain-containing protein [Methanomicrobiales archaeon]
MSLKIGNFSFTYPSIPLPQIGNATAIAFSATQFNPPGDDRQNLNGEWVQLIGRGDDTIRLAGWTLSGSSRTPTYTFPAVYLVPCETVSIFSGTGTMNNTALFMGRTESVWGNRSDIAILKDRSGMIIDQKSE